MAVLNPYLPLTFRGVTHPSCYLKRRPWRHTFILEALERQRCKRSRTEFVRDLLQVFDQHPRKPSTHYCRREHI